LAKAQLAVSAANEDTKLLIPPIKTKRSLSIESRWLRVNFLWMDKALWKAKEKTFCRIVGFEVLHHKTKMVRVQNLLAARHPSVARGFARHHDDQCRERPTPSKANRNWAV
jgi:hypothetical protein